MMTPGSPDVIREKFSYRLTHAPDCIRAKGSTGLGWVGWMTLFSSTTVGGGWVRRHPPYGSGL